MNKDRENARKQDKTVLQWHPAFLQIFRLNCRKMQTV